LLDGQGKSHPLNDLETLPTARLAGDEPVAGATVSPGKGDAPTLRLRITQAGKQESFVEYTLDGQTWSRIRASPGQPFTDAALPVTMDDTGFGAQPVTVRNAPGEIIFRQTVMLRSRIGAA